MSKRTAFDRFAPLLVAICTWAGTSHAVKAAEPVVELRAGSSLPEADQATQSLRKFAELAKQKSGGEIDIQVFAQSLGAEQQLVEGAQTGSIDIGMVTNGNASRFSNAYVVLDLPFLFRRYDDLLDFVNRPLGRKMIGVFENDTGLKHLYMISFGSGRDIQTTKKPLKTPADIQGLKIRTISTPVELATFRTWGANPTPLPWDQTYTSLQQGLVDGMQSNIAPVWAGKFYEVVKYNLRLDYTASFEEVFINKDKFDSLPKKYQDILTESASETEKWIRQYAEDNLEKYLDDLRNSGMQVHIPTPAEYAEWTASREKVWQSAASELGGRLDLKLANQIYQSFQ